MIFAPYSSVVMFLDCCKTNSLGANGGNDSGSSRKAEDGGVNHLEACYEFRSTHVAF